MKKTIIASIIILGLGVSNACAQTPFPSAAGGFTKGLMNGFQMGMQIKKQKMQEERLAQEKIMKQKERLRKAEKPGDGLHPSEKIDLLLENAEKEFNLTVAETKENRISKEQLANIHILLGKMKGLREAKKALKQD